ncbi:GntR family transcriptional regulator [Aliiroseovarius sp. 2305UL8-7]|uniref:GntR family transcriptional regulator n=1 Tax=Aliiroseovarius conchicola TaxID=3121637 RepID=UPI0035281008
MSKARYVEVANMIAKAIDTGNLKEREALPAERALSDDYSVSRETMRKAIKLLETQGYLVSRHGRGTFVAPDQMRHMHRSIDGWSDEARRNGQIASQTVLKFGQVVPAPDICKALELPANTRVLRLHRIRLLDGQPVGLHDSYVHTGSDHQLRRDELEASGSLYATLKARFGLILTDAAESISAVMPTDEEAQLLEVTGMTPLLRIARMTVSDDLRPVEYCEMKYNQRYSYDTVVRRRGLEN